MLLECEELALGERFAPGWRVCGDVIFAVLEACCPKLALNQK